ncbi:hypothetical protein DVH24_006677 [Malus domestica]|uniref:Uncharacterized protein n=1 Tax=Malus domestica TaxID=3750 RepID=A0A498KAQ8_MALDO|nr:hypothetical protein DVH24_006677 [Malus domestica]
MRRKDRRNKEDDTYNCPSPLAIFKFGSQEGSNIELASFHSIDSLNRSKNSLNSEIKERIEKTNGYDKAFHSGQDGKGYYQFLLALIPHFRKVPNVKWKDVGGLEDVKKSILDTVQDFRATLASSGAGTMLQNNPLNDTQLSVSKPTPFDANQRYSCLQHDGLVSRREKSMTHLQEDKQQLRRCSSGAESLGFG